MMIHNTLSTRFIKIFAKLPVLSLDTIEAISECCVLSPQYKCHCTVQVPDWTELHHMANALAGRLYEASGGEDYYTIGTAADIQYSATGGSDDWARGVAGIKWVYLIELPGKGTGFLLPPRYSGRLGYVA